jgi:hypothetical protein
MTPPEHSVPVEVIRAAVARAAAATSARAVARDCGLSERGVRYFAGGGAPRPATLRKLTEWYVREAASAGELDAATVDAALSLLLGDMPEPQRGETRGALVDDIRWGYKKAGRAPPPWLK